MSSLFGVLNLSVYRFDLQYFKILANKGIAQYKGYKNIHNCRLNFFFLCIKSAFPRLVEILTV